MRAAGRVDDTVEFRESQGWVHGFKRRFNLSSLLRCGESGSADSDCIALAKGLGSLYTSEWIGLPQEFRDIEGWFVQQKEICLHLMKFCTLNMAPSKKLHGNMGKKWKSSVVKMGSGTLASRLLYNSPTRRTCRTSEIQWMEKGTIRGDKSTVQRVKCALRTCASRCNLKG